MGTTAIIPLVLAALVAAAAPAPTRVPPARVERGERAYLAYCAMCHGPRGAGDGETAVALKRSNVIVPRLDDERRIRSLGRDEVLRIVREGRGHAGDAKKMMPEWGDLVGPQLAGNIADFVMTLPAHDGASAQRRLAAYLQAPPGAPEEGREIYVYRCSSCHGPQGKGDGPSARMLQRKRGARPSDLTSSRRLSRRGDRELYDIIARGGAHVGRSVQMPSWENDLTPGQIKSVVAYLRRISNTTPRP